MPKGHVLTHEQRRTIIEHRLNGVPVRKVVEITGHAVGTVVNVFREYLQASAAERAADMDRMRDALIDRHAQIAAEARLGAQRARDLRDDATELRYLEREAGALQEIARMTGVDLPASIRRYLRTRSTAVRGEAARQLLHVTTCAYCGRVGSSMKDHDGESWHYDHVMPLAKGGEDALPNLVKACRACNLRKRTQRWSPLPGTLSGSGLPYREVNA